MEFLSLHENFYKTRKLIMCTFLCFPYLQYPIDTKRNILYEIRSIILLRLLTTFF